MVSEGLRFSQDKSVLRTLVKNSFKAIDEGKYEYDQDRNYTHHTAIDLKSNILKCQNIPVITEIKYSSPSKGPIADPNTVKVEDIAQIMQNSGACGLSILSQPYLFNGSITNIYRARKATSIPILMKDIIVSDIQVKAAKSAGADCILLIKTVFDLSLAELNLETIIEYARKIGIGIIIETHTVQEFKETIQLNKKYRQQNLVGINNRNLDTLKISLDTTKHILNETVKAGNVIISESGLDANTDLTELLEAGADAFLIGTSLMENPLNLAQSIRQMVGNSNR